MKWKTKDCLLALFLCMIFVLVVGYGAFSFGGDDMELWQKIGLSILFGGLLIGAGALIGFRIWVGEKPKAKQTCETLQNLEFTVQEGDSNPRKISVSGIQVNCKQGETK